MKPQFFHKTLLDYHINMFPNDSIVNALNEVTRSPEVFNRGITLQVILGILLVVHLLVICLTLCATILVYIGKLDAFLQQKLGLSSHTYPMRSLWPILAAISVILCLSGVQIICLASYWSLLICLCAAAVIMWLLRIMQTAIIAQVSQQSAVSVCGCTRIDESDETGMSTEPLDAPAEHSFCGTCDSACVFAGKPAQNMHDTPASTMASLESSPKDSQRLYT